MMVIDDDDDGLTNPPLHPPVEISPRSSIDLSTKNPSAIPHSAHKTPPPH